MYGFGREKTLQSIVEPVQSISTCTTQCLESRWQRNFRLQFIAQQLAQFQYKMPNETIFHLSVCVMKMESGIYLSVSGRQSWCVNQKIAKREYANRLIYLISMPFQPLLLNLGVPIQWNMNKKPSSTVPVFQHSIKCFSLKLLKSKFVYFVCLCLNHMERNKFQKLLFGPWNYDLQKFDDRLENFVQEAATKLLLVVFTNCCQ